MSRHFHRAETDALRGYLLGAVDYVFKPIEKEMLRAKVAVFAELFKRSRALERNRDLEVRNRLAEICLTLPDEHMYAEVLGVVLDALQSKYGVFGYLAEGR